MRSKRGLVGWVPTFILFSPLALSLVYYCQVNCAGLGQVSVPFGGYKQSGVGKELGKLALDTCVLVLCLRHVLACLFIYDLKLYAGEGGANQSGPQNLVYNV